MGVAYWIGLGGVRSDLPKFKFSVEFPIGLHVILQLQIKKFKTAYYLLSAKLFQPKIRWGAILHPSWNNVKWILFVNYTVIRMLYMPGTCNGRISWCCHIESGFTCFLWLGSSYLLCALLYKSKDKGCLWWGIIFITLWNKIFNFFKFKQNNNIVFSNYFCGCFTFIHFVQMLKYKKYCLCYMRFIFERGGGDFVAVGFPRWKYSENKKNFFQRFYSCKIWMPWSILKNEVLF